MKATIVQLAWYIERDGAKVVKFHADGGQRIEVPVLGGHATYEVPAFWVDELNAERDKVYKVLAAKRRAAR